MDIETLSRALALLLLISIASLSAGCLATQQDVEDAHAVTQEAIQETHASLTEQHRTMHPEAGATIDIVERSARERFERIETALVALESRLAESARQVTANALELASRFAGMSSGIPISDLVTPISEELRRTSRRNDAVLEELREALARTRCKLATSEEEIEKTGARLEGVTRELEELSTKPRREVDARRELISERDDLDERLHTFLTRQELDTLQGLSSKQLLAILAAAIAAAAAGGVFARTGRSRSAGEVEALRVEVARLRGRQGDSDSC